MKLYHATPEHNLKSIMREGIVPGNSPNWEDSVDDRIYLATDPDVAYDFVINSEAELDDDERVAIITIDTDYLDNDFLQADSNIFFDNDIYSYEYRGTVPPSAFDDINYMEV